ncbi:tRNA dihydrouridine synthase DusB [Alkalibacter mobilis]|uniref:tRNA dihydrouridine synthase DusB n=1 Tax=Alkalibacter mobilis TaxID=2787712 RepID=UPI00189D4016|nr:tRNA dihydrouridine synthase DusB [Alkalibacter mobilis]MBF7096912.1 tRNA dihydrouridine synthase DusB [Alkalibacter mobilis]
MIIGNTRIENGLFLAPMAGITNLPFRELCLEFGCGMAFTEMVSAKALYFKDRKTKELMETSHRDRPAGIQLFGSEPDLIAEVIKEHINETPYEVIDINAGCPAPKIVKNQEGSALMKNPRLIGEILEKAVKASTKPVTIKIRAGWDFDNINAVEVAKISESAGAAAITVHGRTRTQFYSGNADWDTIKKVKESVKIPVIGNGDVDSLERAESMRNFTGCDGVMIGRAAMGNPWIFNSDHYGDIDPIIKIDTCLRYFSELLETKPENVAVSEIRKHASWFTKGIRGSGEFRNKINKTTSKNEVYDLFEGYKNQIRTQNL